MTEKLAPTDRTRLRRSHERGTYERDAIHEILDATPLCHLAYLLDGQPALTPSLHWRMGNRVYWHGSSAGRTMKSAAANPVCLNVMMLDGYVLARSAFHHSVNFRSVTLFGMAEIVSDDTAKTAALKAMVDKMIPGRWGSLREMNAKEMKATMVLSMEISEASAKIRTGGPVDDEEDYDLPIWAGVLPVSQTFGAPIADENAKAPVATPEHVMRLAGRPMG